MNVDLDSSTVELGSRTFPACTLRCPLDEDHPEPGESRVLGGRQRGGYLVFIPLESGALVSLEVTGDRIDAKLYARTCFHYVEPAGVQDSLWLPHNLMMQRRAIVLGIQWWDRCEPEWLVEHIDRLATYAYVEPAGPACELQSLHDPLSRFGGDVP